MSLSRRPVIKKGPLSRPQKKLLKESLKKLFTLEFIETASAQDFLKDSEKEKRMVIRNALNAVVLDN